jgi:hypothetical protein
MNALDFEILLKQFENGTPDEDYHIDRKRALAKFLSEQCYEHESKAISAIPRWDCVEDAAHRATMKYERSGDWILFDEAMKAIEPALIGTIRVETDAKGKISATVNVISDYGETNN